MFGISGAEVMIILLMALIVLGPDRLPVVARKVGQVMGELRKVSAGFEAEMRTAMFEADRPSQPTPSTPPAADTSVQRGPQQSVQQGPQQGAVPSEPSRPEPADTGHFAPPSAPPSDDPLRNPQ